MSAVGDLFDYHPRDSPDVALQGLHAMNAGGRSYYVANVGKSYDIASWNELLKNTGL